MLRSLVLLIVTLAAFALAAPAPKPVFNPLSGLSGLKHSFKSLTRGHRGNRDPRTELSRVYNKFNWSITGSWNGQGFTFSWPPPAPYSGGDDSAASSPEDPADPSSSTSAPPSYGSGSSDGDESSDGSESPEGTESSGAGNSSSGAQPPSYGDQPSYGAQPTSYATEPAPYPETSSVATTSDAVASSFDVSFDTTFGASFGTTFSTRVSASASASAPASTSDAPPTYASATASASSSSESDGDGEVQAHPEENESEYLSPVTIGGQELNLNFDTGSADLWVFSTALSSSERGDHAAFDSSKSDTWEDYDGATWDISYGDGSGASGTVGFDQVDVGGITATRQAVEIATAVSSAFVADENNDGLLGLAFGKINTIQPKGQQTFFESVADQLEEKAFTADLDVDAAGTYEFGKIDTEKYQGELHYTKIDTSRGYWEFTSNVYSIGGKDVKNPSASTAIADTGTSLMMVDEDVAQAYYSQIEGSSMSQSAGGYVYPCDADIPSFGVAIGDNGFMAHINGSDIEYARIGQNTCFGGVQGNQNQGIQIYGAVLLKQYFAVFNFGDLTFGLAQKS